MYREHQALYKNSRSQRSRVEKEISSARPELAPQCSQCARCFYANVVHSYTGIIHINSNSSFHDRLKEK